MRIFFYLSLLTFLLTNCNTLKKEKATVASEMDRPNIIWLVAEDLSQRWACYGDSLAYTPNINKLANGGVVYDNAFSVAGVCAPSRSSIITGMYPTTIGTQHMRQSKSVIPMPGFPNYNAVPPSEVKAFPELLRASGYWTASYRKLDYQFGDPFTIWDEVVDYPSWRDRSEEDKDRPFFIYYTFEITHEINIWPDSTKERFFEDFNIDVSKLAPDVQKRPPYDESKKVALEDVTVPPYYPDNDISRSHIARLYDNVSRMDVQIGTILKQLKEDGLEENTIIMVTSDHGDCLPRAKRWIYDSGTKCPLVVYMPEKYQNEHFQPGTRNDDLVSFIDFAPTVLEWAGVEKPTWMQGRSMTSSLIEQPRDYVYGARDRMDNRYDVRRTIRDKKYRYVRNFQPEVNYSQQITFLNQMPLMHHLLEQDEKKKLNRDQSYWLYHPKNVEEELYDTENDPYELNNLAANKEYKEVLERLRKDLTQWQQDTKDLYELNEYDQAEKMWPGGVQPKTQTPKSKMQDQKLVLTCVTEGASIAYQINDDQRWHIYTSPIQLENITQLKAKAIRYGYDESDEFSYAGIPQ
ncbi:sulfatase-like hydrolase/transferase [Flammeovirga yaeyamensis]|uniref:Sulfatase-like hydrolase/transferase n=1 Tax=Flammeovirga yaeyamensis TaxID=367791 RepID=A0AAX1NBI9_9BACT|nr:sulfatase-like hydrolase/transferase [Flammeovirga yaeyamensis]MBB3697215.1 arylsulfatase A-like enzyme [Flammeovirga yaeyamensis]NMF33876.1 sulfatase-like hydrolase/transferase [Flammeovirga yaeyamensis]QWG04864.1 sulfatase-like hydrolase/transferase [Flammeovirga yaeyamensis]